LTSISVSSSSNLWYVLLFTTRFFFDDLELLVKASGVIAVAHESGGPLTDTVVPLEGQRTGQSLFLPCLLSVMMSDFIGYHALTPHTFSAAMHEISTLSYDEQLALRSRARRLAIERFSEQEFEKGWDSIGWKAFLRQDTQKNP
jgi:alpha-1,2-mannosyltransferase